MQSTLDPAGPEARAVAELFAVMSIAGLAIWLAVVGGWIYAGRARRRAWSEAAAGRLILFGAAFPVIVLLALLTYTLWLMPSLRPLAAAAAPELRVAVTGHQYWWEVEYVRDGAAPVRTANRIRLPRGERVSFALASPDVIHSFWIPSLGGKMDMIPGRTNVLSLQADRTGRFRGACAEYCGTSHALMAFDVEVMEPEPFRAWLAAEAAPSSGVAGEGRDIFLANGCGACHTVRGTEAEGRVGPDLSHLGDRPTIGAGTLPRNPETIARFIAAPEAVKPGAMMPAYPMLPERDLAILARWLDGLK